MSNSIQHTEQKNTAESLRQLTPARVASDTIGVSLKTHEVMRFREDFASTKDALAHALPIEYIKKELDELSLEHLTLNSKINNREEYLLRPDLGRLLSDESIQLLNKSSSLQTDLCICVTDGLSAKAVEQQFLSVLRNLIPKLHEANIKITPICIIENGRVAISDQIGNLLNAKLSVIFLGERPGLSSPESMGIYLTYGPKEGNTDANRNCISNIWSKGLNHDEAANTLFYLISTSLKMQMSGVLLKDNNNLLSL